MRTPILALAILLLLPATAAALDETSAQPGEWGFRPADGSVSRRTPPAFSWRPQKGAVSYAIQVSRDSAFTRVEYAAKGVAMNVHCPPSVLSPGEWSWRFRATDAKGSASTWSRARTFVISENAVSFPLPPREEILRRVPGSHPRLFLRPEHLPRLREEARGAGRKRFQALVAACERLLADPPPTAEPPRYPKGIEWRGEEWRRIWWGNRTYTIRLLDGAATLAITRLLGGKEEYGVLARKLLLAAAEWDPRGSTGYRYNDEAGMPYAYHFSRTYTYLHDLLSEAERARCRDVMRVRGREMYGHLHPRHLWRPYSSHANRAWHFLGEVGIAFLGEIPEADEWLWFAVNVFACVYPVWCDDDGGWHEGSNYWRSYIGRFTWWAAAMREAVGLDAYRLPYFSQVGYYPMYLMPPGTKGGGFGDLTARQTSKHNRGLVTVLAEQSGNPHWRWYVDRHGGPAAGRGYLAFLNRPRKKVEPRPPDDLPTSRLFAGTGQAVLNTNLTDAGENVSVIFKSSPFGSQSHGYEAQNSFLLYAFGERLLIRTGRRDMYGSEHHRKWMWQTKSVNSVSVDGRGQVPPRSAHSVGRISSFHTSKHIDYVQGEAGRAYGRNVKRFTRGILFLKPDLIVVHDRLETTEPSTFQWHLHSPTPMRIARQYDIRVVNGAASCWVSLLSPGLLELTYTDKFDPPPRSRVKLTEYHLTAATTDVRRRVRFITVIRPYRTGTEPPEAVAVTENDEGVWIRASRGVVLLRPDGGLAAEALSAAGDTVATFEAK
ncbi:MAG: DUF4962 domain-containing protein [Planctomycetota bacterium]|jgi:hypothetical protein